MIRKERIARSNQAVTDTFATGAEYANDYSKSEMVYTLSMCACLIYLGIHL